MTYLDWFNEHADRHRNVVEKLLDQGLDTQAIIDYFDFDNMVAKEPGFCGLYKTATKCHDMDKLNCYLCACPNFRFDDHALPIHGITTYSRCSIDSPDGGIFEHENCRHQDCSGCTVPHHRNYIERHFDTSWRRMMNRCLPAADDKAD